MPSDFLKKILAAKQVENEKRRAFRENIRQHLDQSEYAYYGLFRKRISQPEKINLIAEIKKASPSKGLIREAFDPETLAGIYEENGAAAISVLTEEEYFLGKTAYLKLVSEKFSTPTLMKDFVIDELQIYEGHYCGASAVLLIVAALEDRRLRTLMATAKSLDLDALVEVHDKIELERALACGADIIGVNNRNLHTFEVDIAVSERMIPFIPKDKVIVAESGITTREDVRRLTAAGAHAVLVGETFLRENDVGAKIKELMG